MRLDHLSSLVAIADHGSFSAAADAANLSHSAVSIQIRQLEESIGAALFDRSTRPPRLTLLGRRYVARARGILARIEALKSLTTPDSLSGRVAFGFVPTTLQTVLPALLHRLRREFPDLQVTARSGLSDDLAADVATGALDFAFLTAPLEAPRDIVTDDLAREPLVLIAPKNTDTTLDADVLFRDRPYIAFSGSTWLGRQILTSLKARAIAIDPIIELDSIDAVENLVARGFGISIVPQRLFAPDLSRTLRCLPFDGTRQLVLASHPQSNRATLRRAVVEFIRENAPPGAA